jgi:hypothetical protein
MSMRRRIHQSLRLLVVTQALFVSAFCERSASATSYFASGYQAAWCKFAQFNGCGTSGYCAPPSDYNYGGSLWPVYNRGGWKILTENLAHPTTGYPLTFVCPIIRHQTSTNSAITVEYSGRADTPNGTVSCTLYSLDAYGTVIASTYAAITSYGGDYWNIEQMSIAAASNSGSTQYALSCTLPSGATSASWNTSFYNYRASETANGTLPGYVTYPSQVCIPQASGASSGPTLGGPTGKLRYFAGKAVNVDTSNMNVECPIPDATYAGSHQACVYLTDATGSTHSSCSLVVRYPWLNSSNSPAQTIAGTTISTSGAQYRCMNTLTDYEALMSYAIVCNLTPGSAINSVSLTQ